jgi:alkanesulfonate monooxygenase SsuD/methylene tetrahydromethanopterin reductase-like flavin-dependent oxidoreductase (luciferase family)
MRAADAAGRPNPLAKIAVARYVYLADSRRQAMDDLRPAVNYELGYQIKRGLIRIIKSNYDLGLDGDDVTFDQLAEAGVYFLGDPDSVVRELRQFYEAAGGFGTLLIVTGKNWATREKVFRSMRLFAEQVAPQLASLQPARDPDTVGA